MDKEKAQVPEAFKHRFNANVVAQMGNHLANANKRLTEHSKTFNFDKAGFVEKACADIEKLELKARSNQIKDALMLHMPSDFNEASALVNEALAPPSLHENTVFNIHENGLSGWMMMPVTDYVTQAALKHNTRYIDEALTLLHACTQRFSAEFSIREFLRDHTQHTLDAFAVWAKDENVHVRRLVSEGCRPYLPWGLRLNVFAENPSLILPLLDSLKDDPSLYVRRSVANNLNDIAKAHPDVVANIAQAWWDKNNKPRTVLIKHACRTLLKNGHPQVLSLFGFKPTSGIEASVNVASKKVAVGALQSFTLDISNNSLQQQNLLIDYKILHQKANGTMSPKVFKWKSLTVAANQNISITKAHSFKLITTRKYYSGEHRVQILINGAVLAEEAFELCE